MIEYKYTATLFYVGHREDMIRKAYLVRRRAGFYDREERVIVDHRQFGLRWADSGHPIDNKDVTKALNAAKVVWDALAAGVIE